MLLDALAVAFAYLFAIGVRFDFAIPGKYLDAAVRFVPVAIAVHIGANLGFRLYHEVWRHASVLQAVRLLYAACAAGLVVYALGSLWRPTLPMSLRLMGPAVAAMVMGAFRFTPRLMPSRPRDRLPRGLRVVVVGAGEGGAAILREIQRDRASGMAPVAIVDDDTRLHGQRILGVPVVGPIDNLAEVIDTYKALQVVLAIPSAKQSLVRRVASLCEVNEVPLRVLPPVSELLGGRVSVRDVRDLSIEDLIGRTPTSIDHDQVRAVIEAKRVFITGAGGSIGSEIARQVATYQPSLLVLVDHDETHLHDVSTLLPEADPVLADIRDGDHVGELLRRVRPDVVFHAAAHKHVPMLEAHPGEAIRTNVGGTRHVVDGCVAAGVARFVLISTDKAVHPTSVMGASKRLAEQITLTRQPPCPGAYCAVRFGNVLGSRGSVIPTFARQIAAGGPVTVTDRRMTRFFISTPEAVALVLQAVALAEGGDIFMLDMGEAVNIHELAKRMIRLSGRSVGADIAIEFTGVRPGEKLVEQLRGPEETSRPTAHPAVVRVTTPVMNRSVLDPVVDDLEAAASSFDDAQVASILRRLPSEAMLRI